MPTSADISAVRAALASAWATAEPPLDDEIVHDGCGRPECAAIGAYFRGRRWDELDARDVRALPASDALSALLSPIAFRYFLPGLLGLVLDELESGGRRLDVTGDGIRASVRPSEGWRLRIDGLGTEKQLAILAFARLVGDDEAIAFWERRLR
jgi:hypothetical protein